MEVSTVNQLQESQNISMQPQSSPMDGQSVNNFADIIALLMQMNGGEDLPESLPNHLLDNLSGKKGNAEQEETLDTKTLPSLDESALLSLGGMDVVLQQLQQTVVPDEFSELFSQNSLPTSTQPSDMLASIASQVMIPLDRGEKDSPKIDFSDVLEVQYDSGSEKAVTDSSRSPVSETNATYQALGEAVSSIRNVKQSLQKDSPEFSDLLREVDDTAIQQTLNETHASAPLRPTEKAVQIPREEQILTQLETGIRENLEVGKREFTMKLKPESLGEITVRLTEEADKMTLHIVTASHKTAGLINDELSTLRQVMAPLQVEVHEAKTVPVEPTASSQSGTFGSMEQNFSDGHFSGGGFSQQQQQNSQYANSSYQETLEDAATLPQELYNEDNLDTYI